MQPPADPRIHLAFRFHANFYHSYRGDTPDEFGFGKDIRIIRKILDVLDTFNAAGVPVRGTWDIENYFSLETIMPEHCPDIIASLQRRVAEGWDEVEVMSYNNGLIAAQTAVEFDAAIGRALSNPAGSGVGDLFGTYAPIVRPQEMMFTPLHLALYPQHGTDCISLYYSAVPFNAFSNFVPVLSLEQRYNPMTLTYPGIDATMTLIPAVNHGDIADNLSLRWWLQRLRRQQLRLAEPCDLLLLIDADADDEFWYGYNVPIVSRLLAATRGLRGLIETACDLEFVTFTTPGEYVRTHPPVGSITIRQDTADGSFDGYASWAEKWSNHALWTGIERSRVLELQARRLAATCNTPAVVEEVEAYLSESFDLRLRALSTTHFGLTTPVMNVTRLRGAAQIVQGAVERAACAYALASESIGPPLSTAVDAIAFTLFDYARGISTEAVTYEAKPSRALVRLTVFSAPPAGVLSVADASGLSRPCGVRSTGGDTETEILFVEQMGAGERQDYTLRVAEASSASDAVPNAVAVDSNRLSNEFLTLQFDDRMLPVGLTWGGLEFADGPLMRSAVTYGGSVSEAGAWGVVEAELLNDGVVGVVRLRGEIPLAADPPAVVTVEREILLAAGLPYLYVHTRVVYPATRSRAFVKERARRLEREYDGNWKEVMPCELRPALVGRPGRPLRVWKHNYLGHVSSYDLNYGDVSRNVELDTFNNHVTHAWVALSDGERGMLVAQTADTNSAMAFCPMRLRTTAGGTRVTMNPFGTYHGKQWRYGTAFTGFGRLVALQTADSLDSVAASYGGRTEEFGLLVAPYAGDAPPTDLQADAEAFAYPYAVVSDSVAIAVPAHRTWAWPEPM